MAMARILRMADPFGFWHTTTTADPQPRHKPRTSIGNRYLVEVISLGFNRRVCAEGTAALWCGRGEHSRQVGQRVLVYITWPGEGSSGQYVVRPRGKAAGLTVSYVRGIF